MRLVKKILVALLTLALLTGIGLTATAEQNQQAGSGILLARDVEWKYDDSGKDLGASFIAADFDDSAWKTGKAPLGFGDDYSETDPTLPIGTVVGFGSDPANKIMTTYFRTTMDVGDLSGFTALECYIHVDDGAVVYINGKEAFRKGIDEDIEIKYDTAAKFKPKEETFTIPVEALQSGVNVIAAQVHQDGGDSSDLWFELGIKGIMGDKAVLDRGVEWKYDDSGKDLGATWLTADFDDSVWKTGKSPLGFGDDYSETDPTLPIGTVVGFGGDPANKIMTTYFRTTVDAGDLSGYSALECYIHVDDGAVIYVNGKEAFRKGIDEGIEVKYDTAAKFKPKEETFTLPVEALQSGVNVICAEVHQDGGDSSDLWFEMGIMALSGIKTESEAVAVTIPDPNAPTGTVSKVTIAFNGDTETSKGFTWYTTLASGNSDLQVVKKEGDTADFSNAVKFTGRFAASTTSAAEVVHKAEATGLEPGTAYFFRVGDEKLGIWSETGTFTTASKDGSFTFIDIADSQAKTEEEAILSSETFSKAAQTVPDSEFIVLNGDIVDSGMMEDQWGWLFGSSQQTLLNTTFAPVAGNHEEDKTSFFEHFDMKPADNSSTESGVYYSFNYRNVHFVMLNTNEDSPEYADFTPAQIKWMQDDVKAAKDAGSEWIIAVLHKGPYTTSNHSEDADIMNEKNGVRTLVAPMMSELGIDLVFQGHDHIYARTNPIKNGQAAPAEKTTETLNGQTIEYTVKPDGTIYVIPATAGPKVYYKSKTMPESYFELFERAEENHAAVYGADPEDASRPVRSAIQNFMSITIDGNKLTAVTYEIDQNKDGAQPFIVDQFGIVK